MTLLGQKFADFVMFQSLSKNQVLGARVAILHDFSGHKPDLEDKIQICIPLDCEIFENGLCSFNLPPFLSCPMLAAM